MLFVLIANEESLTWWLTKTAVLISKLGWSFFSFAKKKKPETKQISVVPLPNEPDCLSNLKTPATWDSYLKPVPKKAQTNQSAVGVGPFKLAANRNGRSGCGPTSVSLPTRNKTELMGFALFCFFQKRNSVRKKRQLQMCHIAKRLKVNDLISVQYHVMDSNF